MKVVVLESMGISKFSLKEFSDELERRGHHLEFFSERNEDFQVLKTRSIDADVLLLSNIPFPNDLIDICDNLKMISVGFTGVDHIGMESCKKRGISVCNSAGYSTNAVAELTICLIIDLLRKVTELHPQTSNFGIRGSFLGEELRSKTIGIIGTGAIGTKVSELLLAFGCKVLAFSRTEKTYLIQKGVKYNSFDQVISTCDVISLHIPLSNETNLLFSKEVLLKLKKGSYIVNTARGKIIDNQALADCLISGHIAGAAVDIYEKEPPIPNDYPLFSAPNIIHTPHIAYASKQAIDNRAQIVIENVLKWLDGTPQNVCL